MGLESVPDTMRAAQVVKFGEPYSIREVPVPKQLKPHEILLKTAIASFCHTDIMVQQGVFGAGTTLPCTGSHEGTGTVVAVGSAVTDFKEGDRMMGGIYRNACGACEDCAAPPSKSWVQYCEHSDGAIGVNISGAFADYHVIDARQSARVPDAVTFETAAPMACAGATIYRGILQAQLAPGEWLAIVGSGGGLGHLGVQFAKAKGLKVIGVDARDSALELSKKCGADVLVDARKGDSEVVKAVQAVTGGQGAAATLNVSDAKSAAATACAVTKRHGVMIQIAQPETVDIPFMELIFRDIKVHGSKIISPHEAQEMLNVVAEHGVSVTVNAFKGLDSIPELWKLAESGKMTGKGVIVVDEEQIKKEKELGAKY